MSDYERQQERLEAWEALGLIDRRRYLLDAGYHAMWYAAALYPGGRITHTPPSSVERALFDLDLGH